MITLLNNIINSFQIILIMSISAAVIFGVTILVKAIAGQRMSMKNHALIWLVFITVLVIPFSLIAKNLPDWSMPSRQIWAPINDVVAPFAADPITSSGLATESQTSSTIDKSNIEQTIVDHTTNNIRIYAQLDLAQIIWLSASLLWLAGIIVLITVFTFSYLRTRNLVSKQSQDITSDWQDKLNDLAKLTGLKKSIELRLLSGIQGPFVFGISHCRIILPTEMINQLDDQAIETILVHELVHLMHRDHLIRLLQCLMQSIHWFNPIVWLAFRWQQRDSEYYCDETTVSLTKDRNRSNYAQILLTTATLPESLQDERRLQNTLLTASFVEINLHKRIRKILYERKTSAVLALAAILTVIVAGCALIPGIPGSTLETQPPTETSGNQPTPVATTTTTGTSPDDSLDLPSGYQQSISRITDGIRLDVLFNQDTWHSGDKIKVLIRVTNTMDQPIPWQAGSTSFGPAGSIGAYIVLQETDIWLIEDGEPRAGDTAMLYGQLEPGASIEKTVVWTTTYTLNGKEILQAWTGKHTLHIAFARGQDDNSGFLSWQQDIQIDAGKDSRKSISCDQAIDIARTQPAFDVFRLAHSGEAVARKEDGQYWVNFSGTWEKVSEELYQETLNKMMAPEAAADWIDGVWTVIFTEKLGDPPNELVIAIDGFTGEVLSRE